MLALKLHKNKRPNIGARSYWIPIVNWNTTNIHLRNWYKTLDHPQLGGRGVNFLTMATIPNDHSVCLKVDWSAFSNVQVKDLPYVPLNKLEKEIVDTLKPLERGLEEGFYHIGQGFIILGGDSAGEPLSQFPELILGEPLPKSCVKWTKDLRLLFRGNTRRK